MKYMGGKSRLVNVIVPILNNIDTYYEPFCGGCVIAEHAKESTVVQDKLFVVRGGYKVDEYFGDGIDF